MAHSAYCRTTYPVICKVITMTQVMKTMQHIGNDALPFSKLLWCQFFHLSFYLQRCPFIRKNVTGIAITEPFLWIDNSLFALIQEC